MSSVFIFLFGLVVGSFLNAVIWRIAASEGSEPRPSLMGGRSCCPRCRHQLSWQDLIPVASFFLLSGRCRYCKKPISWQYPLVELATGTLFLSIFNFQSSIFNEFSIFQLLKLFYLWTIASALIIIFVYDLRHYIIPDKVVYPAIALAFLYLIGNFEPLINYLLAGVGAAAFFFAIYALSRGRWMGFGDVKLALLMGLVLGFPNILVALFVAFVTGAVFGLILIGSGKKQWGSHVPFGPFLIAGTLFALFWGVSIMNWYLNLIL